MTIHHLKLSGSDPRGWGRQQGESLKNEIRELNMIRQDLLASFLKGWSRDKILDLCQIHAHTLRRQDAALYAEAEGISEASGVSFEDLMALNAYTDMRDFSAGEQARTEDGCSILAAKSSTVNFAAQTWDMHGSAIPYMLLLEVPGPEAMHVLTITGCFGLAGVNAKGVSVMINNMHCRETNRDGLVWPALVRKMLRQSTTAEAFGTLTKNIPSSGHNYLVFDRESAVDVETSGRRFEAVAELRKGDSGYLLHTNHYEGALKSVEILERQSPSTHVRHDALKKFVASHPVDGVRTGDLIEGLFVEGAVCEAINMPASPTSPHAAATCGGILVDHISGQARVFGGLYSDGDHMTWTLGNP